ncbi:MAG TPA: gamma carbonic anhydrase family protein [Hyphomicrobiaceae bacterium]|jgi:carbonic anhydrase/acetyltransferase-like protein (isoleucine patch superfamily)|nr:gamma carbonic anhydrase family protein [Hyphomicrobiaceae bacterium]
MTVELQQGFSQAAYIDPTARVFGKVEVGENASLWPYSVIRSEDLHVKIGRYTNLQDHVMVHVGYKLPTIVGDYCSITHRVVLHGCTIGDNCLIGIGATVMEGAMIGENSIVAGHAFVPDNMIVPPNSVVMGMPAKVVRTHNNFVTNRLNAMLYYRNAQCYVQGNHRGWNGPEFEAQMQAWRAEIEAEFKTRYGG